MAESLSARNIVKHYGGVVALSDGNLDVHAREVVALIGANGSGKSTMSKVINGVVVLDGGQLLLDGQPVHFPSPQAAKNAGISTVFQELSLIPQMTVAENIWLTREPLEQFWCWWIEKRSKRGPRNCWRYSKGPSKLIFIPTRRSRPCPPTKSRSSRS